MFSNLLETKTIETLYTNDIFCNKLGKIVLSSSNLEKQILLLIENTHQNPNANKGMLIKYIESKEFFPEIVSILSKATEDTLATLLNIVIAKCIVNMNNLHEIDINEYLKRITLLENKINLVYAVIKEHNKISFTIEDKSYNY